MSGMIGTMAESKSSLPLKLALKFVLNIVIVWALSAYLDQYFYVSGGIPAYIIIGALITLMNIFVRPILVLITSPLRLLATIIAIILVNGGFLYITELVVARMDPNLAQFEVLGGIGGWIVVSIVFGFVNWIIKEMFK